MRMVRHWSWEGPAAPTPLHGTRVLRSRRRRGRVCVCACVRSRRQPHAPSRSLAHASASPSLPSPSVAAAAGASAAALAAASSSATRPSSSAMRASFSAIAALAAASALSASSARVVASAALVSLAAAAAVAAASVAAVVAAGDQRQHDVRDHDQDDERDERVELVVAALHGLAQRGGLLGELVRGCGQHLCLLVDLINAVAVREHDGDVLLHRLRHLLHPLPHVRHLVDAAQVVVLLRERLERPRAGAAEAEGRAGARGVGVGRDECILQLTEHARLGAVRGGEDVAARVVRGGDGDEDELVVRHEVEGVGAVVEVQLRRRADLAREARRIEHLLHARKVVVAAPGRHVRVRRHHHAVRRPRHRQELHLAAHGCELPGKPAPRPAPPSRASQRARRAADDRG
mmetsp:Transcript_28571/g.98660  ORF Transcript_28571/g.98660 Transcript_28571/m.98660 type:complete len:403 (+) Transcript_28571:44-1252(+)